MVRKVVYLGAGAARRLCLTSQSAQRQTQQLGAEERAASMGSFKVASWSWFLPEASVHQQIFSYYISLLPGVINLSRGLGCLATATSSQTTAPAARRSDLQDAVSNEGFSPKQPFCERLIKTVVLGEPEPSRYHSNGCGSTNP